MKIAIVGLGLIGGSLARAIKEKTSHTVIGLDLNREVVSFAHSVGAIDVQGQETDLGEADLTFLCLYPNAVVDFVHRNRERFRPGSLVTDTAGVKSCICDVLYQETLPFTFIGGHPMAGREVGGFENSIPDLFDGASYIFTPFDPQEPRLVELQNLAKELRFGRTVVTTAKQHDRIIAYTSQIAHVLACAYVLSPCSMEHAGFSAGSFRDVSRVAKINEVLWTQLFLDNKEALTAEIDTLVHNLSDIKEKIVQDDAAGLQELLRQGREIKEALEQ